MALVVKDAGVITLALETKSVWETYPSVDILLHMRIASLAWPSHVQREFQDFSGHDPNLAVISRPTVLAHELEGELAMHVVRSLPKPKIIAQGIPGARTAFRVQISAISLAVGFRVSSWTCSGIGCSDQIMAHERAWWPGLKIPTNPRHYYPSGKCTAG